MTSSIAFPRSCALGLALATLLAPVSAWATELVMVEEHGCAYCARWNAEIAPIWPKTSAGQAAPLRRVLVDERPDDLTYARPVVFTPTFLIVEDGRELARMEGYVGDEFFWWHIETMLEEHTDYERETK